VKTKAYGLFIHSFIHIRLLSVVKTQPNMNYTMQLTRDCSDYSILNICLPNIIKIDPCIFELYRFILQTWRVFWHTVYMTWLVVRGCDFVFRCHWQHHNGLGPCRSQTMRHAS